MSVTMQDELTRILAKHREDVEAARLAAAQRARSDEDTRHACEAPMRSVALPLLREWSTRLSNEGYPTSVEDRLACRPPAVVFRFRPRGSPESTLTLVCEPGPAVHFSIAIEGSDAGAHLRAALPELEAGLVLEELCRFVTAALEATIPRRSDCGRVADAAR
jgi:hypothetical protein